MLGKRDSEYSGWIWVTTPNGNQGWAPEQAIEHLTPTGGTALESYSARELETVEKEKLTLLRELNGWLWVENGAGQKGWVPMELTNYQN